jgi:membrane protease YdiL (CAAX protease family)
MSEGKYRIQDSYIVATIKWFSILVIVSTGIIGVQELFGISVEQPEAPNQLIQFFDISLAPIIEEIGFRVILIGVPLFALYTHRSSLKLFGKSLWWPWKNLRNVNTKKALTVIVLVGILFGAAHIFSDESWNSGKLAQAIASGIIIGWVYYRYGLAPAILIHWATNYFIYSYGYIVADINQISINNAFSHSLLSTVEIILLVTGIISVVVLALNYVYSKRHELEV